MRTWALVAFACALGACGGEKYWVVKFAKPNPFTRAGCKAKVEPVQFDHFAITWTDAPFTEPGKRTEAEFLAGKNEKSRASWEEDKRVAGHNFVDAMQDGRENLFSGQGDPANVYTIRVHFDSLVKNEANITVDVVGPDGQVVDRFGIGASSSWGANWGVGTVIRSAAQNAGKNAGAYLDERWLCARRQ